MMKTVASILIVSAFLAAIYPFGGVEEYSPYPYPHYIAENSSRYEAYQGRNPDMPFDIVIAYVNANVDLGFYNEIATVEDPDSISVLVNKNFALPSGFSPDDFVTILNGHRMREEAAEHFLEMREEMIGQGYRLHLVVAYRSYQTQANSYNNAVANFGRANADVSFARPGHSEHQTGLAVDILHTGGFRYMQHANYENTEEFAWLLENAYRYGFILRYPREYRDIHGYIFEPWHWRFVGVDIATAMRNEGIALFEEYYGRYLAPGIPTGRSFRRTQLLEKP